MTLMKCDESRGRDEDVRDEQVHEPVERLAALVDRCRVPLRDFAASPEDRAGLARADRRAVRLSIPTERLPVPESISLVMRILLKARNLGRAEKLAWEYAFSFRGRSCSISSEKFGLRLYLAADDRVSSDATQEDEAMAYESSKSCLQRPDA